MSARLTPAKASLHRLRVCGWLLVCALGLVALPCPALAQQFSRSAGLSDGLRTKLLERGDLSLRDTTLSGALFTISELWNLNIVVGDEVNGKVNGAFRDAPLHEILDALLLSNGYSYRPVGESLVVMPASELGEANPLFQSTTVAYRTAEGNDLVEAARTLLSPKGSISAIASAKTLLVIDYPDRVAQVQNLVRQLDGTSQDLAPGVAGPGQMQAVYFTAQFVPADKLKDAMAAVLSVDGKIAILPGESQVVVIDYAQNVKLAKQVLSQLDRPRAQVRITAYIYDISVEDMRQLGINWNHALKLPGSNGDPKALWALGATMAAPVDAGAVGSAMSFLSSDPSFDLGTVVQALDTARDSRLLADPNVMVTNNERAEIAIVQEIPFQQLTQTGNGGNIGTTAFREAGVKLGVTPHIANNGTILLECEPEFSRLTGYTPEDNQPIIDRRVAKTTVRVVDGHTLVIGGLRTRTDLGDFNGIPYLKSLPHVGFLFRSRETTVRESELVVFIKPEVVTPGEHPNWRESAAISTTRHHLNNIRPGDQGCEVVPHHQVEGEEVPVPQDYESGENRHPELRSARYDRPTTPDSPLRRGIVRQSYTTHPGTRRLPAVTVPAATTGRPEAMRLVARRLPPVDDTAPAQPETQHNESTAKAPKSNWLRKIFRF